MKKLLIFFGILILAGFLRLYQLGQNPPALYWDEASLGYNAFAILTTGHDEHGEYLPITHFTAFGDYKPPGYIYALVPFIKIFGLTELAVRLPSALAGIGMVLLTFLLTKRLFGNIKIGLIAALLLAISPWSLQLSRAGFEAHLAAFFNLLGFYLFVLALDLPPLLIFSSLSFVASFYTFNANRILSPLFLVLLGLIYRNNIKSYKAWICLAGVITVVILSPYISYFQSRESKIRFQEVSIFTSLDIVKKANERIDRSGGTIIAQIIHNRRWYFLKDFLRHYFDNFKGEFLFISGDPNPRLSIREVGEMYLVELPFLLIGLYVVMQRRDKVRALLLGWLLLAPVPAGMARETPHMLRIVSILPTFQIITAIGIIAFWMKLKSSPKFIHLPIFATGFFIFVLNLIYYQHHYWVHYPNEQYSEWQYGYKQLVSTVNGLVERYERVSITGKNGRPYIYFLFYNQISPQKYLVTRKAERDWFGLWNVYGFDKYDFTSAPPGTDEKVLRVVSPDEHVRLNDKLAEIRAPDGTVVYEIGKP